MSNANTGEFRALGLKRDPFPPADVHLDYFARAGRERLLEGLADLRNLARPLIAVVGVAGVGKSTCFHALLRALPETAMVARVTAGVFLSSKSLLQSVARAMGLGVEADESRDALRARLQQQLRALVAKGHEVVVMVDDADDLEEDALLELLEIARLGAGENRVRVMLFAEPRFVDLLRASDHAEAIEALLHEVRLEPYTLNEMRGYLQFRLTQAGLSGRSLFREEDVQRIYRRSRGCPGPANEAATEVLRERMRNPLTRRGPMLAAGSIAAGVLLLLAVVMIGSGGDDAEPTLAGDGDPSMPAPLPLPTLAATEGEDASADRAPAALPVVRNDAPPVQLASIETDLNPAEAGAWLLVGSVEPAAEPAPEPAPAKLREAEAAAPAAMPEPAPAPVTVAVAPAPVIAESAPAPSPAKDEPPLLRRDPAHFTMQVLGTSSRQKAEAWIAARDDRDAFHYYERSRDGEPWFVVVYGDYPRREAANADLASVVRATGVQQPWIRQVGDVQREIAAY